MYELRDSSWHDRGTGHCKGVYDDTQDLALIIVEAEDMNEGKEGAPEGEGGFLKEELLLSSRVEKDDIYARQQGRSSISFQVWSELLMACRHPNRMDGTSDSAGYSIIFPRSRWLRGYLVIRM